MPYDICSPTPSDLQGQVDNLLTRVSQLEQALSGVLGSNVEANQLSDITPQVGWVTGITYGGIGGWTQTQSGTLIPPPGFSFSSAGWLMSDGNTYPAVVVDENGVFQFGFSQTGAVGGAKADAWDAAAGAPGVNPAAAIIEKRAVGSDTAKLRGFGLLTSNLTTISVFAQQSGLYLANGYFNVSGTYASAGETANINITTSEDVAPSCEGGYIVTQDAQADGVVSFMGTAHPRILNLQTASPTITLTSFVGLSPSLSRCMLRLEVVRLGNYIP